MTAFIWDGKEDAAVGNLKNKKRLNIAMIAFMMAFIVGAAFAFAPGQLDIRGVVGMRAPELNVAWSSAMALAAPTVTTTHSAIIVDSVSGSNQAIEWSMIFVNPGVITLEAHARNYGQVPVYIETPVFAWQDDMPGHVVTGLSYSFIASYPGNEFIRRLNPGEETGTLFVHIEWDGTDDWMENPDSLEYEFAAAFFMYIVYTPITDS